MNKSSSAIIAILAFLSLVHGYDGIHKNAGTRYFPFLKIGYDARSSAMCGTSVGMPNDIYGVLSNPGALGFIDKMQAMISYKPVLLDVRGGALGFAWPKGTQGTWAINFIYLSGGVFDNNLYDVSGNSIDGALHPYSIAGSVSWSKRILDYFAVGATLKGIYDRLSEGLDEDYQKRSADGFAADVGVQYRTRSSRLIYGLVVQNLGFIRSSYSDESEKNGLPLSISTGLSYVFRNFPAVRTAFDLEKAVDDYLQYKLGLELNVYKQSFILRGGYNFSQRDLDEFLSMIRNGSFDDDYQKTNWSLVSCGAGVKADANEVDITFDLAVNFRVDRLDPGFVFTCLLGF